MSSLVVKLLQAMMSKKGSDLHIAVTSAPRIRVRGELMKLEHPALTPADLEQMVNDVTSPQQKQDLLKQKSIDFAIKVGGVGIFRVNVFYQRHGLAAVFRALPEVPPTLEDLRAPVACKMACHYPQGLVLVTGPTGSGKSTTLAAMINYINSNEKTHILTLEDPVEFQHESKTSLVNQRQLGSHFTDFSSALKAALREDPDVILVGEMRDPETIGLAITAAETGHLVFGTLHTNSAAKSVDRIIDSFPADQQSQIRVMLSESLRVVLSQKLIPTADGKSRVCVHDILVNTPAVSNLIREGKTFQIGSVMQTGRKEGMQVMDSVILDYVRSGVLSGHDAYEYANEKGPFMQWAPKDVQHGATQVGGTAASPVAKLQSGPANPTTGGGTPVIQPVKKTG